MPTLIDLNVSIINETFCIEYECQFSLKTYEAHYESDYAIS